MSIFGRKRCGSPAPIEAEAGMTSCTLPRDHEGPHRDRYGGMWPTGVQLRRMFQAHATTGLEIRDLDRALDRLVRTTDDVLMYRNGWSVSDRTKEHLREVYRSILVDN